MNVIEILTIIGVVALVAGGIGLPSYLCILGYRRFKTWANGQIQPLLDEGRRISAIPNENPVNQYAIAGFANIGMEWIQTIYVDETNIEAVKDLLSRTASVSYKMSIKSVVGILYGPFFTWINYSSAMRKLAKYSAKFLNKNIGGWHS